MAVAKMSAETLEAIERKSVKYAPLRMSDAGISGLTAQGKFWKPITDPTNSVKSELDRIVDEVNEEMQTECLIDTTSTTIAYELLGYEDKTYTQNITSAQITIPATVEHGFMASVNFKTGGASFAVSFVNESDFTLKKVNFGESVTNYTPSLYHAITLLFICDGNYIYCYINEV